MLCALRSLWPLRWALQPMSSSSSLPLLGQVADARHQPHHGLVQPRDVVRVQISPVIEAEVAAVLRLHVQGVGAALCTDTVQLYYDLLCFTTIVAGYL